MTTETLIVLGLLVLAALLFGLGFVFKWIFVAAVVVLIVLLVQWLLRRARS